MRLRSENREVVAAAAGEPDGPKSGLLAGKVWQSNLHPDLKPLAAALADIGNDDGTSIYQSVEYMAWLLGR